MPDVWPNDEIKVHFKLLDRATAPPRHRDPAGSSGQSHEIGHVRTWTATLPGPHGHP